jgi:hypothetical protein
MRFAPLILPLLVLVLPAAVSAQLTVTFTTSGRTMPNDDYVTPPLGLAECTTDAMLDVRVRGLDGSGTILDVWRVAGTVDCTTTESRVMDTRTCTPLSLMADQSINSTTMQKDMAVSLSELVDCSAASSTFNVWFLVANAMASVEPVTLSGSLQIQYDSDPPSAPTELSDAMGDTMALAQWTQATASDILEYAVYADSSSVAGTCAESLANTQFVEGEPLPGGSLVELGRSSGNMLTFDPSDFASEPGNTAAIVVVTFDRAGNPSAVSNIACASRVETTGFCDAYDCGNGCSASGPLQPSGGRLGAFMMRIAAFTVARRRRRSRSGR